MGPKLANGKICYLEIPAIDPAAAAEFYRGVFDWSIRTRGDGSISFDDTVGQVSGMWCPGRRPGADPGIVISIMVANIDATLAKIVEHGGKVMQPVGADLPEITARFADPSGNVLGLYQDGSLTT